MHKTQIRKEFKEFHKKLWPGMKHYPGGAMIYNIARHSRARSSRKKLHQLDTWVSIYDEYTSWFHSVSISLQDPLKTDRYNEKLYLNRSLLVLSVRIFSDLLAIRSLCLDGFDVQAKNILRSTVENIDVLCAIIIDPDISEKFCDANDPIKSNEFWHRFVSKGKLGKFQIEKVNSMLKDRDAADSLIKMMYKYNEVLGAASHPCFLRRSFQP
ncbi:hypothetical protein V5F29_14820 [Xanthobacter aminoxidans]|uniref:hypothetical protein n=1 Tax=Xanthobacter aminoxidans TaxID=186280 RepID=UPI0037264737